jgi:hypothetical protein
MNKRNNSTWLSVQRWQSFISKCGTGVPSSNTLGTTHHYCFHPKVNWVQSRNTASTTHQYCFHPNVWTGVPSWNTDATTITIVFMCITSFFFANLCITSLTEAVRAKRQRQGERRSKGSDIWRGKVCRPQLYIFRINKREKIPINVCISHVLFPIFS